MKDHSIAFSLVVRDGAKYVVSPTPKSAWRAKNSYITNE